MLHFQITKKWVSPSTKTKIHLIVSKDTLFGMHHLAMAGDLDPACTQTHLVAFQNKADALGFRKGLENVCFRNPRGFPDRVLDGSSNEHRVSSEMYALDVMEVEAGAVEKLCQLHWWCMLVIDKVEKNSDGWIYNCCKFEAGPLDCDVQERYFEDLWKR